MDPYRITTEDGKKVVGMIRDLLAREISLERFQEKLDDFRDEAYERFTDSEYWYATNVSLVFEYYEPNPDIYSAEDGMYNEEKVRQRMKAYLEAAIIEDV